MIESVLVKGVGFAAVVVFGLVSTAVYQLRRLAYQRRVALQLSADGDADTCVACGARGVEALAERAYRCSACGHEGGDGYGAWVQARQATAWQAWPPSRRLSSGTEALWQARSLLASVAGALDHLLADMSLRGVPGQSREPEPLVAQIMAASVHLHRAVDLCRGGAAMLEVAPVATQGVACERAWQDIEDGWLPSRGRVEAAREATELLLAQVERSLAGLSA